MKLPMLAHDKANHYVYGTAAAVIGAHAAGFFGADMRVGAVAAAMAVAGAKELYDYTSKKGTPSSGDWLATVLGAVPVILVL